MAANSKPPLSGPAAIDREERSVDPIVVKEATNRLLELLAWHHGDDEIDREVRS
jgi:hypothetical protein